MEDLSRYNPDGSPLRELQLNILAILRIVTGICERYGIPYWLSGGTLLGAVVHKGFIPWDDDIDMELMRKDYKKLLKILRQELPENLYLQTPEDKYYPFSFSKVRDKNSIVYMRGEEDTSRYKYRGFYIDIVPVERSYPCFKHTLDALYGRALRRVKRNKPVRSVKGIFEYTVSLFLYPLGKMLIGLCRGICYLTKPSRVFYTYGINASHGQQLADIFPLSRIEFEGTEFNAPGNPHNYLTNQYKCDYTVIPPVEGRPQHLQKVEYL